MRYGNQIISSIRLGSQFVITKIMKGFEVIYEAWKKITKRGTSPLVLTNCKYSSSKLPGGYTQLEYIESTGAEYIDTGFIPTRTVKIEDTVSHITTDGTATLFGGSSGQQRVQVYHASDLRFAARAFASTPVNINVPNLTDKYTIIFDCQNTLFEVKDVDSKVFTIGSSGHTYSIALFGNNMEGAIATQSAHRRYSFKIWDNGVLQRDMIPCCRDLDGAIGMYDLVNDVFYENKGSGAFIKGPEVTPVLESIDYTIYGGNDFKSILPDEYQQVEYIQTTGTQYIDSGVPLRCGLKTIVDWVYADADSGNNYVGGHIGAPGNRWLIGSQRQHYYYFGVGSGNSSTGIRFGNRDIVEAYWQNTGSYIKINNVAPVINSFDTLTLIDEPDYTFYMGALDRNGVASLFPKLIIYNWRFYQDDILIRDFVPCYRKSDKIAGLYDIVNNEFYINNGTGEFIVGNPIFPAPTPDAPIEMKGVGDKTNNLFDTRTLEQGTIADATGNLSDSTTRVRTKLLVLEAGTYSFEMNWSVNKSMLRGIHQYNYETEKWETYNVYNTQKITFTLDKKVKVRFIFNKSANAEITPEDVWASNPILQVGESIIGDYEPYGYKTPVTVTPNIYNYEEFFSVPGTAQSIVVSKINFNSISIYQRYQNIFVIPNTLFKPNTTYEISKTLKVISGTSQYNTSRIAIAPSQTSGAFYLIEGNQSTATFTTPADLTDYTYLWIYGIADGEIEIHDISIREVGLEPMTANIYLNEPLRKLGDYVDYINYENGELVGLIGKKTFDGTENWEKHTAITGGAVFRLDGVLTPKTGAFVSDTYMTHFGLTYTFTTAEFMPGFYRFASGNPVDIISSSGRLYVSSSCETVEEFKEWLSVNRPSIYYPLAESETINVELPEVYLPGKTNIITVDTEVSPSEIEITYIGRE